MVPSKSPICILLIIILSTLRINANSEIDFEKLKSTKYFIDKSEMMVAFFDDEISPYHYITYPNGFGKSINIQMLKLFSNIVIDEHRRTVKYLNTHTYHLFQGLKIFKHHHIVKEHLAQNPVLHLTFVKMGNVTEELVVGYLNERLRTCFEDYEWLLSIPKEQLMDKKHYKYVIRSDELAFLEKLYYQSLTMADAVKGLRLLSKILTVYFGKRAIVLIDQYDQAVGTTMEWDQEKKYVYNKINAMIVHALESHQFVQRALIFATNTVLPFRESHPFLNRIRHYSFLTEHIFDKFFGFSVHEMKKLYGAFKCSAEEEHRIREYYGGYKIFDSHLSLFNPRSVIQYFYHKHGNKTNFRGYWKEEERVLRTILQNRTAIGDILVNLTQDIPVSFNLVNVYSELDYKRYRENRFDDLILGFLFDRGYLTPTMNDQHFVIPNVEIKLDIESELEQAGIILHSKGWTRTRPEYGKRTTRYHSGANGSEKQLANLTNN